MDYSQLDLNDDLVAKDLQLTDSDDDDGDSSLTGQGGELCTDENDATVVSYVSIIFNIERFFYFYDFMLVNYASSNEYYHNLNVIIW